MCNLRGSETEEIDPKAVRKKAISPKLTGHEIFRRSTRAELRRRGSSAPNANNKERGCLRAVKKAT